MGVISFRPLHNAVTEWKDFKGVPTLRMDGDIRSYNAILRYEQKYIESTL